MEVFSRHRLTWALVALCSLELAAQRPVPGMRPEQAIADSAAVRILPLEAPVPVSYVLMEDPDFLYQHTDSLDWADNRHVPLSFTDGHLGNFGSATRPFRPEERQPIGAATGWRQYEPYYLHHGDFRFYNQDVPVAQIALSQASQEDSYLTVDFGRSFAQGLNLSMAYRRINQVGEYGHQRQKTTGLGIGLWHDAPNGRYDAFYHFIANGIVSQENGGIAEPDTIGRPGWPDETVPVYITTGITEHKHRSFLTRHILRLTRDSAGIGADVFAQARIGSGLFKYVDESAGRAADYYGDIFFPDSRGIRQFTFANEQELSGGLGLPLRKIRSFLQASMRYRHVRFDQEPVMRDINELYLEGTGRFHWIKAVDLRGDLSLGLGQAEGNFRFKAEGEISAGPLGKLTGRWVLTSRKPYLMENSLYVNALQVYAGDWRNPFVQDLGVGWAWEKQKLFAQLQWLIFDNYIYFDSLRLPQQSGSSFSLQRLTVSKAFDLKWIGLRGTVIWQPDPDRRLAIPDLLATGSLYWRIRMFERKVDLMPGVDLTYHGALPGNSYFPVNGVYHLTGGPDSPTYWRVDAGMTMKISFLQVSLRIEDVAGMFSDRVLYEADFYPHYPGYFRLGLSASFFN